jgi:methylmalonyl-CoA/ethylmalonyl-CoA epimerase
MLTKVDHIGVIVRSLDRAKQFLGSDLGLPLVKETNLPDRGTRAAFFQCGSCEVEVIEVLREEQRKQRLGDNEARIEHIAFDVENLEALLQRLSGVGGRVDNPPFVHDDDLMAFTVPDTTMGVRLQFIQKNAEQLPVSAGGNHA